MILPHIYDVDISQPLLPTVLQPMMVTGDKLANRIGVRLKNGAQPYTPDGSCRGYVLRADGATVPILNGVVNGNEMYIDLPEAAYAVQGSVVISIVCVTSTAITTVFLGSGSVNRSQTDVVIDPGTVIDDISTLIQAIETAVASIPQDYSALSAAVTALQALPTDTVLYGTSQSLTDAQKTQARGNIGAVSFSNIAPTEASTTASMAHIPGTASEYFILSGVLYRATADIASGAAIVTSGTGANCQAVPGGLGGEIAAVKSTVDFIGSGLTKEFDLSDETIYPYVIGGNGKWARNTNDYESYHFARPSGFTSMRIASGANTVVYAFLTSSDQFTYNTDVVYADDGKHVVTAGSVENVAIPETCAYIWVLKRVRDTDYSPTYLGFSYPISAAIENGKADVEVMIAPTESSTTASAAHAAGTYFILGGVLYEATADIASGGSIVTSGSGQNCKVAILGDDVSDLKRAIFFEKTDTAWESGSYNKSDCAKTTNSTRIRTIERFGKSTGAISVRTLAGYEFALFGFDSSGTYLGMLCDDGTFKKTGGTTVWIQYYDFVSAGDGNYTFHLVLRNAVSPTADISVSAAENVIFSCVTDSSPSASDTAVITTTWKTGYAINSIGGESTSSMLKASDYLVIDEKTYAIRLTVPIYAASTRFGVAFYDAQKGNVWVEGFMASAYGEYGSYIKTIRIRDIPGNPKYFRTSWYQDETTYGAWHCERVERTQPYYYICAADSSENDKTMADFICNGIHDEEVIGFATRYASQYEVNEIRFAKGTYSIDGFPFEDASGINLAIPLGTAGTYARETLLKITGDGYGSFRTHGKYSGIYSGVRFVVSDTCYQSLGNDAQYAIFGAVAYYDGSRYYPGVKFALDHAMFKLPDNQKNIICIDGYYMSALAFDDVHFTAVAYDGDVTGSTAIPPAELHIGVDGCMAVRGMQGSCYGTDNIWTNSFAWGFGVGFQVVGEHIIGMLLGTRFCTYGYKFGATESTWALSLVHPITLINCCDECSFNMPIFGHGGRSNLTDCRQPITLIDFNLEYRPEYFALGGDRAKELTAGEAYGSIDFVVVNTQGAPGKNMLNFQFWESGYGENVKTTNKAFAISGTTTERNKYTPTYMQLYFDTTLGKMLVYNGSAWVDMTGSEIT